MRGQRRSRAEQEERRRAQNREAQRRHRQKLKDKHDKKKLDGSKTLDMPSEAAGSCSAREGRGEAISQEEGSSGLATAHQADPWEHPPSPPRRGPSLQCPAGGTSRLRLQQVETGPYSSRIDTLPIEYHNRVLQDMIDRVARLFVGNQSNEWDLGRSMMHGTPPMAVKHVNSDRRACVNRRDGRFACL